jgi:hypothetical protein
MKQYKFIIVVIIYFTGCSSLVQIRNNMQPVAMYSGGEKPDEEISLISGQCYMPKIGKYVEINIIGVDGKRTFTFFDMKGAVVRVLVNPGKHVLEIKTRIGNNYLSGIAKGNEYTIMVEPGRAYQINYEILTDSNGKDSISYSFDYVGTIADYWNYYKMNPDVVDGSPVPGIQK